MTVPRLGFWDEAVVPGSGGASPEARRWEPRATTFRRGRADVNLNFGDRGWGSGGRYGTTAHRCAGVASAGVSSRTK